MALRALRRSGPAEGSVAGGHFWYGGIELQPAGSWRLRFCSELASLTHIGQPFGTVCRYLLRDFVLRFLTEHYPKWGAIDRALEREGWKLVTLLRLRCGAAAGGGGLWAAYRSRGC